MPASCQGTVQNQPLEVRLDDVVVVVGEEERLVEVAAPERLRYWTLAHRLTLGGRPQIGLA